jgi:UDP:flavonoid glycosyltransferase YjiC (YdhE family)
LKVENKMKKVLALSVPLSGHLNILCCMAKELIQKGNVHVVFFSNETFRAVIERSGAEFRTFRNSKNVAIAEKADFFYLLELLLEATARVLPELIEYCKTEHPDLILCDYGTYNI